MGMEFWLIPVLAMIIAASSTIRSGRPSARVVVRNSASVSEMVTAVPSLLH